MWCIFVLPVTLYSKIVRTEIESKSQPTYIDPNWVKSCIQRSLELKLKANHNPVLTAVATDKLYSKIVRTEIESKSQR
ncbi:MAG: hypothetical protein JST81_13675 [Bacteroidetes bacterium]|nr:hypothetical protein [Bacteroidota bacterium]